jgi:hypothetical protein
MTLHAIKHALLPLHACVTDHDAACKHACVLDHDAACKNACQTCA